MKLSLIFSDIEAGAGNATDDFVEEKLLCDTIKKYFEESKKQSSDLILNGDVFDLMKAPYKGKYPKYITARIALGKFKGVVKAHPLLFKTFKEWLIVSPKNRIVFIHGNHDYELVFIEVQDAVRKAIAGDDMKLAKKIVFPGWEFDDGLLLVEHGSQLDRLFRINPKRFIYYSKKHKIKAPFLKLPWGYNPFYDYVVKVKEKYPLAERVVPRQSVLSSIPVNLKKQMFLKIILYMVNAFFYKQIRYRKDPIQRFEILDFLWYLKCLVVGEFGVTFMENARKKLRYTRHKVMSVGHNHFSALHSLARGKMIINTGPWRDEYELAIGHHVAYPKQKSYGYVLHDKRKVHTAQLKMVPSQQEPLPIKHAYFKWI
jgi:UDP-2,3-diacylglucosamine pyrophosphatase LpxH